MFDPFNTPTSVPNGPNSQATSSTSPKDNVSSLVVTSPDKIGPFVLREKIGVGAFSNIRVAFDTVKMRMKRRKERELAESDGKVVISSKTPILIHKQNFQRITTHRSMPLPVQPLLRAAQQPVELITPTFQNQNNLIISLKENSQQQFQQNQNQCNQSNSIVSQKENSQQQFQQNQYQCNQSNSIVSSKENSQQQFQQNQCNQSNSIVSQKENSQQQFRQNQNLCNQSNASKQCSDQNSQNKPILILANQNSQEQNGQSQHRSESRIHFCLDSSEQNDFSCNNSDKDDYCEYGDNDGDNYEDCQYACKIVPKKLLMQKKMENSLKKEVAILKQLDHPYCVHFYDLQNDSLNYYIIMELCRGRTLLQYINDRVKLEENEAKFIFRKIVIAVAYVHSLGIVHRDLKPENIFVVEKNVINDNKKGNDDINCSANNENDYEKYDVKLIDFGLSDICSNDESSLQDRCGSVSYISPEALSNKAYNGFPNDVWALGVILYSMVFGHLPWTRKNPNEIFNQIKGGHFFIPLSVSEPCRNLIEGIMNYDPKKRFTIKQILDSEFLRTDKSDETMNGVTPWATRCRNEGNINNGNGNNHNGNDFYCNDNNNFYENDSNENDVNIRNNYYNDGFEFENPEKQNADAISSQNNLPSFDNDLRLNKKHSAISQSTHDYFGGTQRPARFGDARSLLMMANRLPEKLRKRITKCHSTFSSACRFNCLEVNC